jgi:hypothetical protein
MRRLLLIAALAAAASCGPTYEDVEVDWTFGGQSCAAAGVATIQIGIEGEVLTPDHYTCDQAGIGAQLGQFLTGPYQLTIRGYDASRGLLYQTTQQIMVRRGGANVIPVDVPRVPTGSVTVRWTFDGKNCATAGVTAVNISVDNQVITDAQNNADLPCVLNGHEGVTIDPLTVGPHNFDFVARTAAGGKFALYGLSLTVVAGQDTPASPNLLPAAPTSASANLTWAFDGKSCAVANVDHVQIFFDPRADGSGGTDSGTVPCNNMGTDGSAVEGVPEGYHSFAITGIRAGHIVYFTHHPPSTLFRVGLISDLFVPAETP